METFTNPLGNPHDDFVKETMVEKLLAEVESEVYWQLFPTPVNEEPILTQVYNTKTGFCKGLRHVPHCRCTYCPFNDVCHMKNLRERKLSPFHHWMLDPTESYIMVGSDGKHAWFCQCEKCWRKPIRHLINVNKSIAKRKLLQSPVRRGDLCEIAPGYQAKQFDVNVWKSGLVDWTINAIQKRRRQG